MRYDVTDICRACKYRCACFLICQNTRATTLTEPTAIDSHVQNNDLNISMINARS